MKCIIFLTLTFFALTGCSGEYIKSKNPILGHSQAESSVLWNKLIGDGKVSTGIPIGDTYDSSFRPPQVSEKGPSPTPVEISITSFRATEINETKQTLKFTANLVREYFDSRLQFESPSKSLRFIAIPPYTSLWTPSLQFLKVQNIQAVQNPVGQDQTSSAYLTPQGRVFISTPVEVELFTESTEDDRNKDFSLEIVADKDTVEDVKFKWRSQKPVIFESQEIDGEYGTYSIHPKLEKCKRLQEFGSFMGQQEFSCLRFSFQLVLGKETTVRII